MVRVSVALLSIFVVASPADAHWQYTKWGMSPDEVVAASSGAARLDSGSAEKAREGLTIGSVGTYAIGSGKLPATFYFKDGGLDLVDLQAEGDATCWALNERLSGEYGVPAAAQINPMITTRRWNDSERGNRVEFRRIGDTCWLRYSPLSSPRESEL